ncbi:MAG: hypothetical protein KJ063_15840, partial [Anaerolineae bacterium]|nr:hypothetical protein [Anaerolineae bacterium]
MTWPTAGATGQPAAHCNCTTAQTRRANGRRAYEIAQQRRVNFRPIYLYISDEAVWRERLAQRARQFPDAPVATWTQVDTQRRYFQPWQPGQALFLDGLNSVGDNFTAAMAFIANPTVRLTGWERCNYLNLAQISDSSITSQERR